MYFKIRLSVLLFYIFLPVHSQSGIPIYADYLSDNYYLIHPSMAGAANCTKLRITSRKQWLGQDDSPSLETLSLNGKISEKSAAGIILFNDKNGYHSQKGIKLTFAHHILFSRDQIDLNQLSFGLNAGLIQNQEDQTSFYKFDPVVNGKIQKQSSFNIDFGTSYHYLNFYAHATIQSAVRTTNKTNSEFDNGNPGRYLLSAGYVFGNKKKILWEPSVLFQWVEKTQEKLIDLNLKTYKNMDFGSLWLTISYRRSFDQTLYNKNSGTAAQKLQYITPLLGINYKNFIFAYTYSQVIGTIKFDNPGYHQITAGINLFCKKEKYDCYCPAIN